MRATAQRATSRDGQARSSEQDGQSSSQEPNRPLENDWSENSLGWL